MSCVVSGYFNVAKSVSALAWSASAAGQQFKLDFLDNYASLKSNPAADRTYVRRCKIRSAITGTTAAGGAARAGLFGQIFRNFLFNDGQGKRIKCASTSLRVVNQIEFGMNYIDGRDLGASASGVVATHYTWLPLQPRKCKDPSEYMIPVRQFVDGGVIQVDFSAAAIGPSAAQTLTVSAASCELHVELVTMDQPIDPLRWVIEDLDVTALADTYHGPHGRLRGLYYYIGSGTDGNDGEFSATQETHAAQKITSTTLGFSSRQDDVFYDDYRQESEIRNTAPNVTQDGTDPIDRAFVIPVVHPQRDQSVAKMPRVGNVHFETDTTVPAAAQKPKLIFSVIADRQGPSCSGGPSDNVVYKGANGAKFAPSAIPESLKKILPTIPASALAPGEPVIG